MKKATVEIEKVSSVRLKWRVTNIQFTQKMTQKAQFTHPLPPEIHAQLHALHGREAVIVRVLDGLLSFDTPEDEAAAMSIGEAAQFFRAFYRTVIGHSLTSFTARGTDLSISPNSAPPLSHATRT
jgi:hypothetical protein